MGMNLPYAIALNTRLRDAYGRSRGKPIDAKERLQTVIERTCKGCIKPVIDPYKGGNL